MPPRIEPARWAAFDAMVDDGWTVTHAARECKIDRSTAALHRKNMKKRAGQIYAAVAESTDLADPKPVSKLSPEAQRGLEDFEFFRLRYFGHVSTPWQVDAAVKMVALLESPDKEYACVNVAPGAGKSTTFVHDLIAWIIARNRGVRVLIGSRTERQARQYVGRLKTTMERTHPPTASDELRKKGLAVDAVATLTNDYGRFKPTNPDVWRSEEFTVAQPNDIAGSDKERTVSAFGMDGGFLGGRYDLVVWDDLVDKRSMRTAEARESLINMWETEAETRLEPGGLLILQGQRMRADDLYRYALDLKSGDPDDYEDESQRPFKYHHIIYRAHDVGGCTGLHAKTDPPWKPDGTGGCLLDPVRLDWKSLKTIQSNRAERFLVMYQQEDMDPANALFDRLWIYGGLDPVTRVEYPGCFDDKRGLWELPPLAGDWFVAVTADPSPTQYWSVQLWAVHLATDQRFLLDHVRAKMDVNEFLSCETGTTQYTGLLVDWHEKASAMGRPFTHVIFEINAAQRYFLDSPIFKSWAQQANVRGVRHSTALNKIDADYGVQSMTNVYERGLVRLPWVRGEGRLKVLKLVDEILSYPEGATSDCVMAQWFLEYNLPKLRDRERVLYRLRPDDTVSRRAGRAMPGLRAVG